MAAAALVKQAMRGVTDTIRGRVVVIGGGIVGCAIARELARQAAKVTVLEAAPHLGCGASGGNSGILCTGYDTEAGSVERMSFGMSVVPLRGFLEQLRVPHRAVGSLVVAWDESQLTGLEEVMAAHYGEDENTHVCGVAQPQRLSAAQVLDVEPHLRQGSVVGGVLVPGEVVVDPWMVLHAFVHDAMFCGATFHTNTKVTGGRRKDGVWTLETDTGRSVEADIVVNAAGLFADHVEQHVRGVDVADVGFDVRPRRGDFVVYRKLPHLLTRPIQPAPTQHSKGVFVFKTVHDNIVVGPTAIDTEARELEGDHGVVSDAQQQSLHQWASHVLPALEYEQPIGTYSGLRPATQHRDYIIRLDEAQQWVTVAGIRSTGVSASCGIASCVLALLTCMPPPWDWIRESPPPMVPITPTGDNQVTFADGRVATITHPITKFGLAK